MCFLAQLFGVAKTVEFGGEAANYMDTSEQCNIQEKQLSLLFRIL